MTEFYIVREYNGGTQFKPQKVYALRNYFTQWFYTFEDCMAECEIRQANVVMQTTTDLDVLKKKVAELEEKKVRLINAGLHPESRNLYETLPRVGGWQDVTYDPTLSIFLGNIYQQKIKRIGVQCIRPLQRGFRYVIELPYGTEEAIVAVGPRGNMQIPSVIEGDRVKRVIFHHPMNGTQHFTVYAKLSESALYRKPVSEITNTGRTRSMPEFQQLTSGAKTGRFSGTEQNSSNNGKEVDHRVDALRYAFGGYSCGKTSLKDIAIIGNADNARDMLERFRKSFPLPKFPPTIETGKSCSSIDAENIIAKAKEESLKLDTGTRKLYDVKKYVESTVRLLCEEINKRS